MMLIHNTYLTVIETEFLLSLKSFGTFNDNIRLSLQIYWDVIRLISVRWKGLLKFLHFDSCIQDWFKIL